MLIKQEDSLLNLIEDFVFFSLSFYFWCYLQAFRSLFMQSAILDNHLLSQFSEHIYYVLCSNYDLNFNEANLMHVKLFFPRSNDDKLSSGFDVELHEFCLSIAQLIA